MGRHSMRGAQQRAHIGELGLDNFVCPPQARRPESGRLEQLIHYLGPALARPPPDNGGGQARGVAGLQRLEAPEGEHPSLSLWLLLT